MPARHRVDPIRTRPVPKRAGGVRLLAELSPRDAAVWDLLGRRLAPLVERHLSAGVLAERAAVSARGWIPAPIGRALRAARRAAAGLAERAETVSTDVRACYGSMRPEIVAASLRGIGAPPRDAGLAADMVEGWGSEGYPGLPIGPRASAAVAGAILLRVDRGLSGAPFLRWVDDYLLPASVLDRLDEGLARVGLTRSVEKTVEGPAGVWGAGMDPYPAGDRGLA